MGSKWKFVNPISVTIHIDQRFHNGLPTYKVDGSEVLRLSFRWSIKHFYILKNG